MAAVLGIDPGLASTGFGVIHAEGGRMRWVEHGVIRTPSSDRPGERLLQIAVELRQVVERHRPILAGIESLYFTRNVTSAIPVAQARGVVLMVLEEAGVPAEEFTPQAIKQAVVGTGQADKEQVAQMVRVVLGLPDPPQPDHAADALAAAITRWNTAEAQYVQ